MLPEIKCSINENDKLVKSLTQIIDFQHLYESLDTFETELNATITKLIRDKGDLSGDYNIDEENDDSEVEVEEQITPRKKKKN